MANPITGGTHYRQEKYTNEIIPLMRQELNIRADFSRDFEGDPTCGAVKVPVRNLDVTVSDYNVGTGSSLTQSATTYLNVLISHDKVCNELIDGYEADAVPDNLIAQRLESAGYAFGLTLETNAINQLVLGGTKSTDTATVTDQNVYKKVLAEVKKQKKKGIKVNQMKIAVNADVEEALLSDDKFANTASTIGAELVREGVIGKVAGVPVKPSYLLPTGVEFIVYAPMWCQAIDAWKKDITVNDLSDGKHVGASALQGRMVYEDVVTNADAVIFKANSNYVAPSGSVPTTTEPAAEEVSA